jgi:hypothetical protein
MFYIIERSDQLQQLNLFEDCFIKFIPKNNNFHPALTSLSLIYIRPINGKKGYMLCLDHNESFSLNQTEVFDWLVNNTNKLWVIDKKESMYWFPYPNKLFDVHLLEFVNLSEALLSSPCIDYYYTNHINLPNVNCLIPISKHYEECEAIFKASLPIIQKYTLTNTQFQFQNFRTTEVFYQIEKNGIKLDKTCFISYYKGKLQYPEFNLSKSRIYTQYNLYNTTSRPSNTYNSINFAALNKEDGERICYKPDNDMFIEIDFQGYHPRLIGELIGFDFPKDRNTYDYLGELLGVSQQEVKELTFKQLYGGVWNEYQNKPFFKNVVAYVDDLWNTLQYGGTVTTENKIFIRDDLDKMTPHKLLNYVVQSKETSTNVKLLEKVFDYLKDKKTKIILYTYDSILLDHAFSDGDQILIDIKNILYYPVNIKIGKNYHTLEKI